MPTDLNKFKSLFRAEVRDAYAPQGLMRHVFRTALMLFLREACSEL